MITSKDLASAISMAEPLFGQLQGLYRLLPETLCTCDAPGTCCMLLPEMTALEALQWIKLIESMSDSEQVATMGKFVEFYLTNPARLPGCPFREDGACSVYPYRTFGCRSYGLWSQEMGRTRTQQSRNSREALRKMWQSFGIEIPAGVLESEMDYCDMVQTLSGKSIADDKIMDLLIQVYHLGKSLGDLQSRFEEVYHSDFSFLLTSLVFGTRKALLLKFAVIKEIVQKETDTHLQEALEKVSPGVLSCP